MIIKNELKINNDRLAYCVGNDIPSDFSCKRISVGNRIYNVIKSGSSMSLSGQMSAILQLAISDSEKMPTGEFKVIL